MTKNVYMVIGANYGDEGKGQTVNHLCQQHNGNKIVVLTNGSSQRGHTAVNGNKRHIFHHFGSGLLADADSFFSKDFIVNPLMFLEEEKELEKQGIIKTRCFVHKDCKVAFPYDMFVNQVVELSREDKHGSCGCGVWETLKRYETVCNLTIEDLYNKTPKELLMYIRLCGFVCYSRAEQIIKDEGLKKDILLEYKHLFEDESMSKKILETLEHFFNTVKIVKDCSFLHNYETVVFENGQGLLLDKRIDKKLSTPSITGCENILTTINDGFSLNDIVPKFFYVTRTYITRHGSTDFKEKCNIEDINVYMVDETNQPNPYQGTLMYGKLNYEELYERVENDIQKLDIPLEYGLSVTHTSDYPWFEENKPIGTLWLSFFDGNVQKSKFCPLRNKETDRLNCNKCTNRICMKEIKDMRKNYFNAKETKEKLVKWIRDWFEINGKDCNAIIGLSGGKDSNVVAALCVEALGKDRVIGVTIPNIVQTDETVLTQDLKDINTLVEHLGIRLITVPIGSVYSDIMAKLTLDANLNVTEQTKVNLSPRLRMSVLYAVSQSLNGRVANTCNRSEEYVGYSTRYGDGGTGDFSPLGNLTVTEILKLGKYLDIPYDLVKKTPADGLCGQPDEDNLGFTYAALDKYIREGVCENEDIKNLIDQKHNKNLFKLQPIPTFTP